MPFELGIENPLIGQYLVSRCDYVNVGPSLESLIAFAVPQPPLALSKDNSFMMPDNSIVPFATLVWFGKSSKDPEFRASRPIVAIGNFDGAHRGHASVASAARQVAAPHRGRTSPVIALTFDPHPRAYFRPHKPFFRLTEPHQRAAALESLGFDAMVTLTFDDKLAGMSADGFVRTILCDILRVSAVVVGSDFHFGKDRAGTPDFLAAAGREHGFLVRFVPPFRDLDGSIVSSSEIRKALSEGDISRATRLLGRPYEVEGTVIHGAKRGRELGYPTANIALPRESLLKFGVYAVRMVVDGVTRPGVASFGRRPMFDNGAPLLEVFLFNFSGDLYGKHVRVSVAAFIREEEKFSSLDALITQMDLDQSRARRLLDSR
ncbi:RibF FAD synthase [Rhabdaerophilaceae bacterium]